MTSKNNVSILIPNEYRLVFGNSFAYSCHTLYAETLASGVDFLGWVHFPNHRILRTVAKRIMFKNIKQKEGKEETVQSYLGLLRHGNSVKLKNKIIEIVKK